MNIFDLDFGLGYQRWSLLVHCRTDIYSFGLCPTWIKKKAARESDFQLAMASFIGNRGGMPQP